MANNHKRKRFDDEDRDDEDWNEDIEGLEDLETPFTPIKMNSSFPDLTSDFLKTLADGLDPVLKSEKPLWEPLEGPQTLAFYSEADELFYGGAAGGGKSDLMLGLALSDISPHKKAIVFRKSYGELKDIIVRGKEILEGTGAKFKAGSAMRFDNLPNDKSLELGSVLNFSAAQKYKGRPHDLKLFDELSDIDEIVYTFLIGWARTATPGLRVRVVSAGNPPTTAGGQWVIRRWRPWLDSTHHNPAKHGELRWFAMLDGDDIELDENNYPDGAQGKPFLYTNKKGETNLINPKSRTFIGAKLENNPFLLKTDYMTVLQNMVEPFRSQLLLGDFGAGMRDDPYQVIPSRWVRTAMDRFKVLKQDNSLARFDVMNTAFGLDVSEAGADTTMIVKLTGHIVQFVTPIEVDISDPLKIPQLQADQVQLLMAKNHRAPIGIDAIGIGIGLGSHLRLRKLTVMPIKGQRASTAYDETGQFMFSNLRCELWWRMREAFDPKNENALVIPDDPKLYAELTAPKFTRLSDDKIVVESKKTVKERLGYSPDRAEALMYALYARRKNAVGLRIF